MRSRSLATIGSLAFLGGALLVETSVAQNNKNKNQQPRETVSKGLSERQKRRNEEKLRKELETPYKKWLNEEVTYIITDEERKAFGRLQTDEERQQFIEIGRAHV